MSTPRKVYNIQLVQIQPEESLANTSEQTFTPDKATYLLETKREGYRATTQVKGLSSEIIIVSDADAFHLAEGRSLFGNNWRIKENLTGAKARGAISKGYYRNLGELIYSRKGM